MNPLAKAPHPFLTAKWLNLVMLNYEIEPVLLNPHVPRGTTVDRFDGKTFVSVIGFQFFETRLRGRVAIPFHRNFLEVNLRFYVRREQNGEVRRGVVFVAEIVPRYAIALIARLAYNENYFCYPMSETISGIGNARTLSYAWTRKRMRYELAATTVAPAFLPQAGTVEQFITEHYWGYAKQRDGGTVGYQVAHEPWRVWHATQASFSGDGGAFYGAEFQNILKAKPHSAFVAEGSAVSVFKGRRLAD
jgi:uncharacterized protein